MTGKGSKQRRAERRVHLQWSPDMSEGGAHAAQGAALLAQPRLPKFADWAELAMVLGEQEGEVWYGAKASHAPLQNYTSTWEQRYFVSDGSPDALPVILGRRSSAQPSDLIGMPKKVPLPRPVNPFVFTGSSVRSSSQSSADV